MELTPHALATAWQRVVDRTPVLRSRVIWQGVDKPLQLIHRQVSLPITHHDWRALPPQKMSPRRPPNRSDRSPKSKLTFAPPPGNPPARPSAEPNASYCFRFSGSERTSYAPCTSLKRSSFPGFVSGCTSRTSLRYAFLISSCEAFFETPRAS